MSFDSVSGRNILPEFSLLYPLNLSSNQIIDLEEQELRRAQEYAKRFVTHRESIINGHMSVVEFLNLERHPPVNSHRTDADRDRRRRWEELANLHNRTHTPSGIPLFDVAEHVNTLKRKNTIPRHPQDKTCNICLENDISDENIVVVPCCSQIFCRDCLSSTIKKKNCCPLCRCDNFK